MYNITPTLADDIVATIEAIVIHGGKCEISYISDFTDLSSEQVKNATEMSVQLDLIEHNDGFYIGTSMLSRAITFTNLGTQKAIILRLALEQYQPYKDFKDQVFLSNTIADAARKVKAKHGMSSTQREILSTLISLGTYTKSMTTTGAGQYIFKDDDNSTIEFLESTISKIIQGEDNTRILLGGRAYSFVDQDNVFTPLATAIGMDKNNEESCRNAILFAGNSFESFLYQYTISKGLQLSGSGIIQKANSINNILSNKHIGIIQYIGQIRNAADHGADPRENGKVWTIDKVTATVYPIIVAQTIKGIISRDNDVPTV